MTLGKHFLIGLRPTPDLHPDDKKLLSALKPAGVIMYRANFDASAPYPEWHARFARLVEDVRDAIGRREVLVGIDHEGGTVLRPPAPITPFAFARQWADRPALVGAAMGQELASLGVNLDFAPVVDIDSNPQNPVIGPRAFGTTAEHVASAAIEFVRGIEGAGVLACAKHFPGHGDTTTDSHLGLPVLDMDLAALRARELVPFARMIESGIQLIMTAHILFPAIDATTPATMSRRLVTDVLRGELGYTGAIVTDDLGMRAVSDMFDQPGAVAKVLDSGTDLVMICSHWTNTDRAYAMVDDLQRSLDAGALDPAIIDAANARIDALIAKATHHTPRVLDADVFARHAASAPLRQRAGAVGQTVSLEET